MRLHIVRSQVKRSKPWFAGVFTLLLAVGCSTSVSDSASPAAQSEHPPFTLSIAHINDTHSAFDPIDGQFQADAIAVYNQWGGHPRLLTRIEQHRQSALDHKLPFLVLHGGDAWQGTAYFKVNEGRMNADILSRMGIDAMALGNHEFDLTNALLNEFIDTINFPLLAANIDTSNDADLHDQANLKAFTLFSFEGPTKRVIDANEIAQAQSNGETVVAVFGLALDDMPNISPNVGDVIFHDMVESAQATVDTLSQKGVAHILAVTHIGNASDVHVASHVDGIDAIIGGHSHTLLGDFRHLGLGQSERPYAERIANPNGETFTCVVQAGEFAQAVGLLEISFDQHGQVSDCGGGNTLLTNDRWYQSSQRQIGLNEASQQQVQAFIDRHNDIAVVAEDEPLRAHIDTHYKPAMEAAYGEQIAYLQQPIAHVRRPGDSGSSEHGSELAPLIATAQFAWASQPQVQAVTGLKPDFALVGAGGIRMPLEEGELREGSISLEVLPFASQLSIVPLRGSVVREVIEQTVSATLPQGAHAGRFPYGGMLRYEFVETEAGRLGQVTSLEVNVGEIDAPRWRPIEDNVLYNVVLNSYIATGNDGWLAVAEAQQERSDRIDLAIVDGRLTAFPVARVEQQDGGRLRVEYMGDALQCDATEVECNTDALSVIHYLRKRSDANNGVLAPLDYPTVTLQRDATER